MAGQDSRFNGAWQKNNHPGETVFIPGYGFDPLPAYHTEQILIHNTANTVGQTVIFVFLISLFAPLYFHWINGFFFSIFNPFQAWFPFFTQLVATLTYCLAFSVPFWIYCSIVGMPLRVAIPIRKPSFSIAMPAVFISLGVSVFGIFMAIVISSLLGLLGITNTGSEMNFPADSSARLLYYTGITVLPAIFEEFAFRGFILQSLRRFGDGFALIVSSILFSLVHADLGKMPNAFLLGIVIGYFVIYTGSIWTGVLIHFVNNTLVLLFMRLADFLPDHLQTPFYMAVYAIYLIVGITSAVILTKNHEKMFTMMPAGTVSRESQKLRAFFTAPWIIAAIVVVSVITVSTLEFL